MHDKFTQTNRCLLKEFCAVFQTMCVCACDIDVQDFILKFVQKYQEHTKDYEYTYPRKPK